MQVRGMTMTTMTGPCKWSPHMREGDRLRSEACEAATNKLIFNVQHSTTIHFNLWDDSDHKRTQEMKCVKWENIA